MIEYDELQQKYILTFQEKIGNKIVPRKYSFNSYSEAKENEKFLRINETDSNITMNTLIYLYLKNKIGRVATSTLKMYEILLPAYFSEIGNIPYQKITPLIFDKFLSLLMEQGKTSNTLNKIIVTFKDISLFANSRFFLNNRTYESIKKFKKDRVINQNPTLSLQDFNKSLEKITYIKEKLLLKILFYTGIRIGEALALQRKDIDLNGYVHIYKNKQRDGTIGYTKTKYSDRKILLPTFLLKELVAYFYTLSSIYATDDDFLFDEFKYDTFYRKIKRNLGYNPHELRRAFATNTLEYGVPLNVISKLLGHADIETTATYLKITNTSYDKYVDYLNNLENKIENLNIKSDILIEVDEIEKLGLTNE